MVPHDKRANVKALNVRVYSHKVNPLIASSQINVGRGGKMVPRRTRSMIHGSYASKTAGNRRQIHRCTHNRHLDENTRYQLLEDYVFSIGVGIHREQNQHVIEAKIRRYVTCAWMKRLRGAALNPFTTLVSSPLITILFAGALSSSRVLA